MIWSRCWGIRSCMIWRRGRMVRCCMVNWCVVGNRVAISFFPGIKAYFRNGYSVTWNKGISESIVLNKLLVAGRHMVPSA